VADQLGQPLGSVKSWVRRGLQTLRACLNRAAGLAELSQGAH
jgi:RNA polymerase sigma-70 factor (ECF subfamily)